MNGIQFGRWLSERRRSCGWRSQRALAEAVQQHPALQDSGISEDFLARLEAGHMVFPFRGMVRRRVILLAQVICKGPRDLRNYLRVAGLNDLNGEEQEQVRLLQEQLVARQTPAPLLLPPRPQRLIGRDTILSTLLYHLRRQEMTVCALTGMAGVGKSALAAEALHQLVEDEQERLFLFPDGILTVAASGLQGSSGLITLLSDITDLLTTSPNGTRNTGRSRQTGSAHEEMGDTTPASAITRARAALAGKRMLLLIDGLEANFPLRQALDALLAQSPNALRGNGEPAQERRVILLTSRSVPAPSLVTAHLRLPTLDTQAAHQLLAELIGREAVEFEPAVATRICTAVDNLPLALEGIATALLTSGMSLPQLATGLKSRQVGVVSGGDHEIAAILEGWLAGLDPEMRERYIMLSTLGEGSFRLEAASALEMASSVNIQPSNRRARGAEFPDISSFAVTHNEEGTPTSTKHLLIPNFSVMPPLQFESERCTDLDGNHHTCKENGGSSALVLQKPITATSVLIDEKPGTQQALEEQLARTAIDLGQLVRHSLLEVEPQPVLIQAGSKPGSRQEAMNGQRELRYRMPAILRAYSLSQVQQLAAERRLRTIRSLQNYALDYLTQYAHDEVALEREATFLRAAIEYAWEMEHYEAVTRIVQALEPLIEEHRLEDVKRLLSWGLYASQQQQNWQAMGHFLKALGMLRYGKGDLKGGRNALEQSAHIIKTTNKQLPNWLPFSPLFHVAMLQEDWESAQVYAQELLEFAQRIENPREMASAHYYLSILARMRGEKKLARQEILRAADVRQESGISTFYSDLYQQIELARIEGDFFRAQSLVEIIIEERRGDGSSYMLADTLMDQTYFAFQEGLRDEARVLATRTAEAGLQAGAFHFYNNSMRVLQRLEGKVGFAL